MSKIYISYGHLFSRNFISITVKECHWVVWKPKFPSFWVLQKKEMYLKDKNVNMFFFYKTLNETMINGSILLTSGLYAKQQIIRFFK